MHRHYNVQPYWMSLVEGLIAGRFEHIAIHVTADAGV
jgi:hypothetical protein